MWKGQERGVFYICNMSMRGNLQAKGQAQTQVIYLIGEDGSDKSFLFNFLQLQQEELNQQINVYVKLPSSSSPSPHPIQLYDFPTDRMIRSAMGLYLKLLPPPTAILYCLKDGASEKEIIQWIKVLQEGAVGAKVAFLSDVSTYLEREKMLTRLAREFQSVLEITFFVRLEPYAFRRAFERLQHCGVEVSKANCLKPTLTKKIVTALEKIVRNIRKKIRLTSSPGPQSVV